MQLPGPAVALWALVAAFGGVFVDRRFRPELVAPPSDCSCAPVEVQCVCRGGKAAPRASASRPRPRSAVPAPPPAVDPAWPLSSLLGGLSLALAVGAALGACAVAFLLGRSSAPARPAGRELTVRRIGYFR